jgi:hypothetical protein
MCGSTIMVTVTGAVAIATTVASTTTTDMTIT